MRTARMLHVYCSTHGVYATLCADKVHMLYICCVCAVCSRDGVGVVRVDGIEHGIELSFAPVLVAQPLLHKDH